MKNLGTLDRLIRVIAAEIFLIIGFFWAGFDWQIPLYLIAVVMLIQAASASCGLYRLLGWNSCEIVKRKDKRLIPAFVAAVIIIGAAGGYGSIVLTENAFLEDLDKVSLQLNSTINAAGQNDSEKARAEYGRLLNATMDFENKYSSYRPFKVKFDLNYETRMNNISRAINASGKDIFAGDLIGGREMLLKAIPDIENMLKR